MVGGVLGEVAANLAILAVRKEHAQILCQQMEVLSVLDLQVKLATRKHVQVIIFIFILHHSYLQLACSFDIYFQ